MHDNDQESQDIIEGKLTAAARGRFGNEHRGRVRTFEVDAQNIAHNAVYVLWLETARLEYFRALGLPMKSDTFIVDHRFVVARLEIDYLGAAFFDDRYTIVTRVNFVKRSSFGVEQFVLRDNDEVLAQARGVLVNLEAHTHRSLPLPETVRTLIRAMEGEHCIFITG